MDLNGICGIAEFTVTCNVGGETGENSYRVTKMDRYNKYWTKQLHAQTL